MTVVSATRVSAPSLDAGPLDFREIGDHLYDGVYITDGAGRTLYVNRSYLRITGLAAEEVLGRRVQDLVSAGLYSNAVTPEVLRLRTQVNSVGHSARNGARMLISGIPIFDTAGEIKFVAVVEREISDLASMQAMLEASDAKIRAARAIEVRVRREVEHLRRQNRSETLLGRSPQIAQVFHLVERVARTDATVLIEGESGVGKEVVANEIHRASQRKGSFIKVNCAALPATLLEAELFGYDRGAFTGAAPGGKIGLFELADHGTLLLDEIGDLPLELQVKLLRAIQHKEVTRLGGTRPIRLDVRLVAATNADLRRSVREGRFREDLFYRLAVYPITLPPLREREEDIILLSEHFLEKYNQKYNKIISICEAGQHCLLAYGWPGNIRELQNVIERIVLVSDVRAVIDGGQVAAFLNIADDGRGGDGTSLPEKVDSLERREIVKALATFGSTRRAALALGIDQSTIVKKARRLGITAGAKTR